MTRRGIWIVLALAAAVVAAGLAWPGLRGLGGATDVPTATAERGEFLRRVEAEGNLEAAQATVLSAPANLQGPARIAWLAPDGTRVDAGDVVIRFDPTDFEKELREGQAERDTAQSKITQRTLTGGATLRNLDRDAELAGRELEYAREFQSKDADVFSRSEIIESEIDEELATHRRGHARETRDVTDVLSGVEVDLLAIERKKAEIKIQRAEQRLQALEVRAPHDGIFVLKDLWGRVPEVGMTVWVGHAVAELPQLDRMEGKVYVLEADAGGLREGLEAEVVLEAHPGEVFPATVQRVDALPTPRVRNVPVQYFAVKLELARTDPERMKPGQRIRATLFLDRQPDALTVPREALFDRDGKKVAYVRRGGGFEPVEVTPGPAALGRVVIEQGLQGGDVVALRDPTRTPERPTDREAAGNGGPGLAGARR